VPRVRRRADRDGGSSRDIDRITSIKVTFQVERRVRQKYRCACNGAVVTAPGPAQLLPSGRYAPEFAEASPSRSTQIICRSNG
jgi:hypothetical protein